jgi:ribosomal protein S12 methylthiotransferase
MKFHVITLGCDKNTVDSERFVAELAAHGATPSARADDAELIVVNTCGFIDAAKRESIDAILEAVRFKETGRCQMVAAVGCMVERHKSELADALPEVDLFLGTSESDQLVAAAGERGLLDGAPLLTHPGVRLYTGELPHIRYLKISEGCDHGCAFCAIPLMRGRHRSFTADELVRETQLLQLQGAREVNLVAQDLAHYGRDVRDGAGLPQLLRTLLAETDIPWFRLLYIYSAGLTHDMLELLASEPRILRYLDIPMQHAADTVLARMRRPERKARQREKLRQIREMIPDVAIRTTVIVGFPGETEAEFAELLDFLEESPLERVGVFTYSPQEGTRAYDMADDVPEEVKRERAERVEMLQRQITAERYEGMLGRVVRGIVDRAGSPGRLAHARIYAQADDVDGVTWLDTTAAPGTIVDVRLSAVVDDYDFRGEVVQIVSQGTAALRTASRRALPLAPSVKSHSYGKPWPA